MKHRVLIIDDDANLLSGLRRQLHHYFHVEAADNGEKGIAILESSEPFAVALCDMRMPGLNGVETLMKIRQISPETVRMMLTGNVDQQTAIDAVNHGHIFRFLNKPVARDVLMYALDAGIEQHRLITAERELLSKTLSGSVKLLTDVLSLANPPAFARTSRVRRLARELAEFLNVERVWEVELAASLSQVGCVALHDSASRDIAQVSYDLIANIPRLEAVAQIVANQDKRFSEESVTASSEFIPLGARILTVALDYDELIETGHTPGAAIIGLRSRRGWYDPNVLDALEERIGIDAPPKILAVSPRAIPENAILAENVRTNDGTLLLAKGQEIGRALRLRLISYARHGKISELVKIKTSPDMKV